MSTENGTRVAVAAGIVIVAGVLITGAALTKFRFDTIDNERRNAATEHELRRLQEAELARVRAQEEELRLALIAPMPREKRIDPAVLEQQKRDAQRGCQLVAQAVEAYALHPSAGNTREECLPKSIRDLLNPPWGGPSYLKNREADTIDPWGNPYQFEPHKDADGTATVLVITFGPDKVPISQFGIGDKARPRK